MKDPIGFDFRGGRFFFPKKAHLLFLRVSSFFFYLLEYYPTL